MVRNNYVVHFSNLKYYLEKKLKLVKVHRVLIFKQSKWLASYIEFCTEQRKLATTTFQKDFWKKLINAFFGKTCENKRGRIDVELLRDNGLESAKTVQRILSKPNMHSYMLLTDDLYIFYSNKKSVKLDRPIYIGAAILDLSKLFTYVSFSL